MYGSFFFGVFYMKNIIVTGSYGKTSTVCLLNEIIENTKLEMNVYKSSINELENCEIHPHILIITNISSYPLPEGIHTYKECIEEIDTIMQKQNEQDLIILNSDYAFILSMINGKIPGKVEFFNIHNKVTGDTFYDTETETISIRKDNKEIPIIPIKELKLPGFRNNEVFYSVVAAMKDYVDNNVLNTIIKNFSGAESHFEYLGELNSAVVFNNAHAEKPSYAVYSLMPFEQKVIFITGGQLMDYPYHGLGLINVTYSKELILIGESADKIEESTKKALCYDPNRINIYKVEDLAKAVEIASKLVSEGDIIMFSPSTPISGYKNYQECGRDYKRMMLKAGMK